MLSVMRLNSQGWLADNAAADYCSAAKVYHSLQVDRRQLIISLFVREIHVIERLTCGLHYPTPAFQQYKTPLIIKTVRKC